MLLNLANTINYSEPATKHQLQSKYCNKPKDRSHVFIKPLTHNFIINLLYSPAVSKNLEFKKTVML